MVPNNNLENGRCMHSTGFASKFFFLVLGGSVGAAIALLLAPKPGYELRRDIADTANRRYEETLEAANRLKDRTDEYYKATREKGEEVLNVVVDGASVLKQDLVETAAKISGIVGKSA